LLNSLLLLAEPASVAAAFALRRLLFSAAEKRDYEGVFIACQVSFVSPFGSLNRFSCDPFRSTSL
ncbi:hypothetical protein, partial [Achromobacter kerstersii]|uniref:hypothetical protein n=1 Tax=Achromobacter kerstersii TaxID=1353890 RepID=UPI00313C48A1